jgi:Concanavalin A-like lectin/glucanases superfamily
MDTEFLHKPRSQQIIAIASILSVVLATLIVASLFNPELSALERSLGLSTSKDKTNSNNRGLNPITVLSRSPDFHAYNSFLDLRPSTTISLQSNSSLQLNEFTVSAWFKTSHFYFNEQEPTPYHFIVVKGGTGSEAAGKNMNYGIWMNDLDNIQGGFETETGTDYFVKAKDIKYNDGKWHYVALTYDGNVLGLYIDGTLKDVKITDDAKPDSTTISPLSIGVKSNARNGFFIGSVDEINIWNIPLSEEQLKSLYESGGVSSNGLVFHMPFE